MIILALLFVLIVLIVALSNWATYTENWVDDRAWHFDWQTVFMLISIAVVFAPVVFQ